MVMAHLACYNGNNNITYIDVTFGVDAIHTLYIIITCVTVCVNLPFGVISCGYCKQFGVTVTDVIHL